MKNRDDNNNIGNGIDDGYIYIHIHTHVHMCFYIYIYNTNPWIFIVYVQGLLQLLHGYSSFKLFFRQKFLHGSSLQEAKWP